MIKPCSSFFATLAPVYMEFCQMTAEASARTPNTVSSAKHSSSTRAEAGIEDKAISFEGRPDITQLVERYVRRERSHIDPQHRTRVENLADDEPLFLTRRGTGFNYDTFRGTWRRIYPYGKAYMPNGYSIHDLRHLLVTELLLKQRQAYGATSREYAEAMEGIRLLFGWRGAKPLRCTTTL